MAAGASAIGKPLFFSVNFTGQIESVCGLEEGLTQMARSARSSTSVSSDRVGNTCVWNFPIEITFKSTNVFGWPQLVVSVYGLDGFGRDVVRGYGSLRLPLHSGRFVKYIPLFVPLATSPFNYLLSWFAGRLPEFVDPAFVSKSEGREVTRVSSQGSVKVVVDVLPRDMERFGYQTGTDNT
ncbi:B9-domain-containing protein [Gonapodya prolifera JEL478]|uniref:B9 domain-containing protein 1 n=1 Tax=Gonapodya prolifera (strain JEL478) TaxID=1344416 RepID=A0A139APB2_GONPJ|nr:B9-domain-containing protein [Gonapodya prolifera JEL478]|eukprot:KXS18589.1 B9-domain-containing protein [Gonapodya prolifera JEL478]